MSHRRFADSRVAVIYGGLSQERDVSLISGAAVAQALEARGYQTHLLDAGHDLAERLLELKPDVVYNALHGTYGEDGRIQGLLDWMGIPYTGEGIRASLIAFDKGLAKSAYRQAKISVARDVLLSARDIEELIDEVSNCSIEATDSLIRNKVPLTYPVFVKPTSEGSSVGVSRADTPAELGAALHALKHLDVLIEDLVVGPELSVVCIGRTCLGSVEIEPVREFYDYEAKYGQAGTRYHVPPRLDASVVHEAEALGLAAHNALGCQGVTRSDLIIGEGGPIVLETNTLPGMTPSSLVPKVANHRGWSFEDLIEKILELATCASDQEVNDAR